MEEFDAIVVGGGPAGLGAAHRLAEQDASVLCLDKKQEIGVPKRCAEGLGRGWFERLNLKPDKAWAVQEIFGAALYAPSGKKLEIIMPEVAGHILERRVFEKFLANQAVKAGARIKVKANVHSFERSSGKVVVRANENGAETGYKASIVIAADGIESTAARKLGLNTAIKLNDLDAGFQYEMSGIDFEQPELIHLFFGKDVAPRGYVWIFPKGKNHANVGIGIGGTTTGTAKSHLDKFVQGHDGLKNGSIIEVNCGCIPVGGFLDDMTADNLLVAGDAAHQVNPIHGGGIGIAMEAADIAAAVAAKSISKKDFSHGFLQQYNALWYRERGNQLKGILKRRLMFESLNDIDFETIVGSMNGEDVLRIAEGDLFQSAKIIGKKLIRHPRLAQIMLKYLK